PEVLDNVLGCQAVPGPDGSPAAVPAAFQELHPAALLAFVAADAKQFEAVPGAAEVQGQFLIPFRFWGSWFQTSLIVPSMKLMVYKSSELGFWFQN
ncbi:hypothetical protein, partial [Archaeoglobus sp.]